MSHPYQTSATEPYVMYPQEKEGFHKITVWTYLNDTDISEITKEHAAVCAFSKIKWKRENASECRILRDARCLWGQQDGHYEWTLYIRDAQNENTGKCGPDLGLTQPSPLPDPLYASIVANPNAPTVSWALIDNRPMESSVHPYTCIRISIDRDFPSAAFVVSCEWPCRALDGRMNTKDGSSGSGSAGAIPHHSEVAAFTVVVPNPMTPSTTLDACVESSDSRSPLIDGVTPAKIGQIMYQDH
jgi:hypothetical protein